MNRDQPATAPAGPDHVGSLARGLQVLEVLAAHPGGMTLTEMAAEAGLTRAGARRFLLTLVASGYATQDGRKFRLSPRLISVARRWLGDASLWTFAEPFMREVSQALNESCSAAVLDGADVVYVARVAGRNLVSIALHVGTRLPAYCTSMGRVLLSGLPPADLSAVLEHSDLAARTNRTVTDPRRLAAIVAEVGRDGFALVDQELELGLRSIAVPVHDRSGRIVAAINVSTQSARLSPREMVARVLPPLRAAAGRVEDYFVVQ